MDLFGVEVVSGMEVKKVNIQLFFPLRSLIVPCGGDRPKSRTPPCVTASLSAQDALAPSILQLLHPHYVKTWCS